MRFRFIYGIANESKKIETIGRDVNLSSAYVSELDFTYFSLKIRQPN